MMDYLPRVTTSVCFFSVSPIEVCAFRALSSGIPHFVESQGWIELFGIGLKLGSCQSFDLFSSKARNSARLIFSHNECVG
jgi:hypothetical protein